MSMMLFNVTLLSAASTIPSAPLNAIPSDTASHHHGGNSKTRRRGIAYREGFTCILPRPP
jgi:hypothetical protein